MVYTGTCWLQPIILRRLWGSYLLYCQTVPFFWEWINKIRGKSKSMVIPRGQTVPQGQATLLSQWSSLQRDGSKGKGHSTSHPFPPKITTEDRKSEVERWCSCCWETLVCTLSVCLLKGAQGRVSHTEGTGNHRMAKVDRNSVSKPIHRNLPPPVQCFMNIQLVCS